MRVMRRWLLRFFERGPFGGGFRFGDAGDDGSSSVLELSSDDDAGCNCTLLQRTDHERAHIRSPDLLPAGARASRPPLLQNR